MRLFTWLTLVGAAGLASCGSAADPERPASEEGVLRFALDRLNGEPDHLSSYRGSTVLVVNTASECGYTPQFAGLERLWRKRRDDGLVVLGFPANDFAGQEPRSNDEIATFCRANFGVTFPMFAKLRVTGDGAHPLFKALGAPDWNFNKYLLDREGRLVGRWGADTEPDDPELTARLEETLRAG